jgi:hypothetical protein
MPVQKFRDSEAARRALACAPTDPRLAERIRQLWAFSRRLTSPQAGPRGVFKYRSIEEANAARRRWEAEHVERLRARRQAEGR